MRYLITGGQGYLGSVATQELIKHGAEVFVFDNGLTGNKQIEAPGITYIEGDVRDLAALQNALQGIDGVIHLAAIVGDRACDIDPDFTWDTNYLGTVNIAKACKGAGVKRLVFASTCSNYGIFTGGRADPQSPLRPRSLYAQTKIMAEHHLLSIGENELDPCIVRLATLYGLSPRMRFDLVINRMTASAAIDGQVIVYGGGQWRPFVHVRDAARVMIRALTAHSQPTTIELYNCGSEEYRLLDAGDIICRTVGNADLVVFEESTDTRSYRVDLSAIFDNLGYTFENNLVEGVKEIAETLKDPAYPDFRDPVFDNGPLTEEFAAVAHVDQKVAVSAGSSGG